MRRFARSGPASLFAAALLAVADIGAAQEVHNPELKTVAEGELGERIVEFVTALAGEGFSGAVLAAVDGKVVAAVGIGHADVAGTTPITPATLMEIASLTKQFTGAAVMRLVSESRLSLDDSIALHLPDVPENARGITVGHLLRHTSGIPASNAEGAGDDIALAMESFLRGGPQHEPGTHWEYWNQGYALLSEIIARASGVAYTTYLKESIFLPAKMHSTRFTGDAAPEGATVALGRSQVGPARSALEHPYGEYGFQYRGMGGVVTSVWDLWRWDRALHAEIPLDAEAKEELFRPGINNYALGWFVTHDPQGRVVHAHGGRVRGFTCDLRRYPAENALVVVLANRDDYPTYRVTTAVSELLFGEPVSAPPALAPLSAHLAESLVGSYETQGGHRMSIATDGAVVRATLHWPGMGAPVTNAKLGHDATGGVILDDGSPVRHPVEVVQRADEEVTALLLLNRRYERRDEAPRVHEQQRPQPNPAGMTAMIATSRYTVDKHGVVHLPPSLRWIVLPRYQGITEDGSRVVDERVTLVLSDPEQSFWPVIVRMDLEHAERLAAELAAAIREARGKE